MVDDLVADRWRMTATHSGAPSSACRRARHRFTINGVDVSRFDGAGWIPDVWHTEDFARLRA